MTDPKRTASVMTVAECHRGVGGLRRGLGTRRERPASVDGVPQRTLRAVPDDVRELRAGPSRDGFFDTLAARQDGFDSGAQLCAAVRQLIGDMATALSQAGAAWPPSCTWSDMVRWGWDHGRLGVVDAKIIVHSAR